MRASLEFCDALLWEMEKLGDVEAVIGMRLALRTRIHFLEETLGDGAVPF